MHLLPCPQCRYFFKDLQVRFPRSSAWDGNLNAVNFMEGLLLRERSWGRPGRVAGRHEVGMWSQLQADSTGSAEAWNHHVFGPVNCSKKQAFLPMPAMWDASKGWGRWEFGSSPRMRWCCSQSLGWLPTSFPSMPLCRPHPHWVDGPVWPTEYCGDDRGGLLKLDYERRCRFSLALSWIACPAGNKPQHWEETQAVLWRGHCDKKARPPANSRVSEPSWEMIICPPEAFRGLYPGWQPDSHLPRDPSQNPWAKQPPHSWTLGNAY